MGKEATYLKALSLLGETGTGSNTACVDVADGKIIRIRPLHYDWKQDTSDLTPQIMEARGKVLGGEEKTLLPPHSLGYKKRAYSPNRIPCPLKRIDWDPNGERNQQKRGESKYVPISWDEALDIVAGELRRVIAKYGPETVLAQADGHGETGIVHPSHGCNTLLLKHLGDIPCRPGIRTAGRGATGDRNMCGAWILWAGGTNESGPRHRAERGARALLGM